MKCLKLSKLIIMSAMLLGAVTCSKATPDQEFRPAYFERAGTVVKDASSNAANSALAALAYCCSSTAKALKENPTFVQGVAFGGFFANCCWGVYSHNWKFVNAMNAIVLGLAMTMHAAALK